jgi:hypothetical protein
MRRLLLLSSARHDRPITQQRQGLAEVAVEPAADHGFVNGIIMLPDFGQVIA